MDSGGLYPPTSQASMARWPQSVSLAPSLALLDPLLWLGAPGMTSRRKDGVCPLRGLHSQETSMPHFLCKPCQDSWRGSPVAAIVSHGLLYVNTGLARCSFLPAFTPLPPSLRSSFLLPSFQDFIYFAESERECERGEGQRGKERERISSRLLAQHRARQRAPSPNSEIMT